MQEGPGKGGQSSDESLEEEEAQRCPICLNRPRRTERAVPDCCRHVYCLDCIRRWAQMVQSCPVDRRPFSVIYLQGSSQQCIKLPVKAPRLSELHPCCSQDGQRMCRVSVEETGSTEGTQEKRANAKLKCHRKSGDSDESLDKNRKEKGNSCHSLLLAQHCHSSLPSQQGATVGTLTQIMTGSVEVCEEGPDDIQWRRLERKRRWFPASVPASRVSLRSHLLLSAVSASLNVLLSEHTVPHGLVCAVTCPKGEEKKGTRGSGSKTSVKPAEAAATRRSSRHSRSEAEDSSAAQSETTDSDTNSSTPQTLNDTHASTSRGQQGNNPKSGAKMRGRPKKVKVARPEDEEQETEVGNHEEDGVTEETEPKESKTDQEASSDQIDGDQVTLDMEEKMEVENQTSPAEDEHVSPDASSQEEETAKVEVVTETMVEDEDNQVLPQEDSKQEVETNDQDLVELVNVPPIQEQDSLSPSPSCVELQESQSDSKDSESSLQAEPTAEPPEDASDQIADLKPEPDTTENCLDKQESSSPPLLQEDQAVEASVPEEKGVPESKDTNASSPQDNNDLIPMECDSPVSESEARITEAGVDPIANVPQMDDQEPKLDSCKEEKGSDKREREGRSRRSRFHSPTTTWSPNRESRNEGSRRSRSRSRDRSHKTRSTSRSREQQQEARDGRRNRSRSRSHSRSHSRERSRRRRSRSRNRNRPGRRSPSQERADQGGHSPRKRESWGGDGWRSRGSGQGFRNSNWRDNVEKPRHFSSREPVSSDNGNFHEASPDRGRSENPDWVQERERLWADTDSRGREPRRDENAGDPPAESWPRGSWNAGRGRGGTHWTSSQQGEPADNWRQRTSFSGTSNNADSYNRFNDNRAGGKRRESEGAETPLDRSGWSSASSWAVRRTLPADVQNYYSRRDRGGNNNWNRQEEDQGAPGVPKQADPLQNEPNAPPPTEAVPAMPPPMMPHQMGVMGVLHYPMGPLLPRPPAVGLQPPPQFSVPPPVPVQLHPTRMLLQVPSIAVQGLPPPPPPPPPVQHGGFTVVPSESHLAQVMPSFPAPGKGSFKPMPTKVVPGPPAPVGTPSAAQPSSTTTQPSSHSKAHADSSKKEKKLQIQERAVNAVKAAIKPYFQKNEINKEEYKEIVRKAVEKVCHSKSGEVNADKVANLVKAYVDKYKRIRKSKTEKS
ncbi:protein SCAF11-like isoform X2 [Cyprinus carpio]|uniref:Protein SCAF11-like isoform X2 n=1 Tax=Cyprinus carpio TaxID=7962 RepID=A0A9R0ACD1_CYPCA|nr:protein SCAF11-like isoform X2 [Cyprinus carpio]